MCRRGGQEPTLRSWNERPCWDCLGKPWAELGGCPPASHGACLGDVRFSLPLLFDQLCFQT